VPSLSSPATSIVLPDRLRPEHVREYQAYLFRVRKLDASSVTLQLAALRFFFVKTLKRG
jgi:integrase/recombinase XerD